MSKFLRIVACAVVLLFAVVLVDYLLVRRIGVRMLPVDYLVLRRVFYMLGVLTLGVGVIAYRRPARERVGFFRMDVAWHRLVVLFCGAPIVATVAGFLGRFSWLADLFAHFRVQYAVTLFLGTLALIALRQRRWAGLVAAFSLINGLVVAPQYVPWPSANAESGASLRFVLANVNVMNEDSGTLLKFLDDMDADVILLEEVSARWLRDLVSLSEEYPHVVKAPRPNPFGICLWSRVPLRSGEIVTFVDERYPSIVARLDVSGEEILFVGTHPTRPRDARSSAQRDQQLHEIASLTRNVETHVVVLGDLNTTPWSHGFRSFVAHSGLVDSSLGMGPQWSWPAQFWPLAIPIDHALVSESLRVVKRFIGPHIGSDHYPLVLDLSL